MLEIATNFRISLDLFELATVGMNYGLQTAGKTITSCTKVTLLYFIPFQATRRLEMVDTLMRTLLSKMPRSQKSNELRCGDFGGYCVVEMK